MKAPAMSKKYSNLRDSATISGKHVARQGGRQELHELSRMGDPGAGVSIYNPIAEQVLEILDQIRERRYGQPAPRHAATHGFMGYLCSNG
jgi:hypothetical protein